MRKFEEITTLANRDHSDLHVARTYNSAISTCARCRQWQLAVEIFDTWQERSRRRPNLFIYSAAISACEKGQQWQCALELLVEMRAFGITPDVISYNAAISACEKGQQWQRALELLEEMKAAGVAPNVIS